MEKRRRIASLAAFLLMAAVAAATVPALADPRDRLDEIERKKERVREQRAAADARGDTLARKIARLDAVRARVESQVDRLDSRISRLDGRIQDVTERLTVQQVRLSLETDELQSILSRLDTRSELFENRAKAAYMAGPTAYLDSLLSSDSFNDLIDRSSYYESALDADSELISEIEVLRGESEARREGILEKQHSIAMMKRRLESDRAAIAEARAAEAEALAAQQAVLSAKRELLRGARRDESQFRALENKLEQDSQQLTQMIQEQQAAAAAAAVSSSVPVQSIAPPSGGRFVWPAPGGLTSPYGWRTHPIFGDQRLHTGIDIGAGYGAPVYAGDNGTVSYVGAMSGYGNVIVVDHGGGISTTYNHLSAYAVGTGQSVGRGQQIGNVGCTGYCTGPHLHFEVRVNGSPVDPMPYLE